MEILLLKELLAEKGMTGKGLAAKVGVTQASISNIAQGRSFPKPELLVKIAEMLDVDIRDLFKPTKEAGAKDLFVKDEAGNLVKVGTLKSN